MGCHQLGDTDGNIRGFVCLPNIYEYAGFVFEFHDYLGPTPLRKKDREPMKRIPLRFWYVATVFGKMTKEERKEYLIFS